MSKLEYKTVCGWFTADELKKKLNAVFEDGWSISHDQWIHELNISWQADDGKKIPIYFFCVLQRLTEPDLHGCE